MGGPSEVRRVEALRERELEGLAALLVDVVEGGASVGFMQPLTLDRARAFWRRVGEGLAAGDRLLFVAEDATGVCGTVQLVFAQPENQPHRGDLSKMLVHRRARRRGVGAALMRAAEAAACANGRTVLVLDTASDDARRLYERHGWVRVGDVPDFALLPEGAPCATTFYFRRLGKPSPA